MRNVLFILAIQLAHYALSIEVKLQDGNFTYDVHRNQSTSGYFSYDKDSYSSDCALKNVYYTYFNHTNFLFGLNETEKILKVNITHENGLIDLKANYDQNHLKIYHKCLNLDENNTYTIINVNIETLHNELINFNFLKFCKPPNLVGSLLTTTLLFLTATFFVCLATNSEIKFELTEIKPEGELKSHHAVLLIVSGSIILLLIFYFINYLKIIFTILVTFQITTALYLTMKTFYEIHNLNHKLNFLNKILFFNIEAYSFILMALTGMVTILYLITRHWILNNIFGFCLIFVMLSLFHIRSFKICTVLLVSAFIYDVFWVYISPYIFTQNVMVVAATKVNLPIKLEFPIFFQDNPIKSCMFLGLGDIVLPGFILKFCKRYDFLKNVDLYHKASIVLYFFALTLSGLVIYTFNYPQPVLFYMCPVLIIGILGISYIRQDRDIWNADRLEDSLQIIENNFNSKDFTRNDIEIGHLDNSFTETSFDSGE